MEKLLVANYQFLSKAIKNEKEKDSSSGPTKPP